MKNVSVLEEFEFEFVKFRDGDYVFQHEPGLSFFEAFQNTEVKRAALAVIATVKKLSHLIEVDLSVEGTIGLTCDRCLVVLDFPVLGEHKVLYHLLPEHGRETAEGDEPDDLDMILVAHFEISVNYAQPLYESLMLSLPMIRNCDDLEIKPCDSVMLEKLNILNGSEQNEPDPRWDKLKEFLKK